MMVMMLTILRFVARVVSRTWSRGGYPGEGGCPGAVVVGAPSSLVQGWFAAGLGALPAPAGLGALPSAGPCKAQGSGLCRRCRGWCGWWLVVGGWRPAGLGAAGAVGGGRRPGTVTLFANAQKLAISDMSYKLLSAQTKVW